MKVKIGKINKLKWYAIIMTITLTAIVAYTILYPTITQACYDYGYRRGIDNIINMIRQSGNIVAVEEVGNDLLVCNLVGRSD